VKSAQLQNFQNSEPTLFFIADRSKSRRPGVGETDKTLKVSMFDGKCRLCACCLSNSKKPGGFEFVIY